MKNVYLLLVVFAVLALACSSEADRESPPEEPNQSAESRPAESLSVFAVNYPLQYLAERLGGDLVEVSFPAPADVDPAYWAPSPEEIAAYQQADLILLNGLGYAKWLERATLPSTRLVDTSLGYEDRRIPLTSGAVHSHGLEGEHSHKGYAFTSWLDPRLAVEQARSVAEALSQALPQSQATIEANLASLITDLEDLNNKLEIAAQAIGDQPLLFSHPVYQYLEAGYGLSARSVHWEPDEPPAAEKWREMETILANHPARWMIWEGDPLPETVQRLADIGVQSVVYDPCANVPSSGDLMSTMENNIAALTAIGARE